MTITAVPTPPAPVRLDRFDATQYRAAEVAKVDPDAGTVLLRAAPYDVEAQLDSQLWESFAPGTFARAADAPHRVTLNVLHSQNAWPVGRAHLVEDRTDGLWVTARFANTVAGQEARELAHDGTLGECSVEFRAKPDWYRVTRRRDGLHIRHARAHLLGVALVPHGAYADDAFVASVRSMDTEAADLARQAALAHLRALTS
jgi:hypothetical protein